MRSHRSNCMSSTLYDALAIQAGHLPHGYTCLQCSPPSGREHYCRRCFLLSGASQHCLIIPPPSGESTQGRSETSSSPLQQGLSSRHSFPIGRHHGEAAMASGAADTRPPARRVSSRQWSQNCLHFHNPVLYSSHWSRLHGVLWNWLQQTLVFATKNPDCCSTYGSFQ